MPQKKYTPDILVEILQDFYQKEGRAPKQSDNVVRSSVLIRYFGSFNAALTAANIPIYQKIKHGMAHCSFCSVEFRKTYETHRFCSKQCYDDSITSDKVEKKFSVTREQWKEELKQKSIKYFNQEFEVLGWDTKRKRVLAEQNNCCARCGLAEWLEEPLTLEVDHKDGNRENHLRDNLEALCPNCHSLTHTWRGRNTRNKNVSDDDIIKEYVKNGGNIRQTLICLGLSPKGGNYDRIKKIINEMVT